MRRDDLACSIEGVTQAVPYAVIDTLQCTTHPEECNPAGIDANECWPDVKDGIQRSG